MAPAHAMSTGLGIESEGLELPLDELPPWEESRVKIFPLVSKINKAKTNILPNQNRHGRIPLLALFTFRFILAVFLSSWSLLYQRVPNAKALCSPTVHTLLTSKKSANCSTRCSDLQSRLRSASFPSTPFRVTDLLTMLRSSSTPTIGKWKFPYLASPR